MPISLSNKKKMRNALFIVLIVLTLLTTRLAYIQFVWGAELSEKAGTQQSQSRTITAKRGTIYDATGKYILAESSSVEFVSVNPTNISDKNKEIVAKALSNIFELDYEKVLKNFRSEIVNVDTIKSLDKITIVPGIKISFTQIILQLRNTLVFSFFNPSCNVISFKLVHS